MSPILTRMSLALLLITAVSAESADTPEAARVAAWVRTLPAPSPEQSFFGALGGISLTHMEGPGGTISAIGPAAFYADSARVNTARTALGNRSPLVRALASGGIQWMRDVQNVPWGLIEPSPGDDHFELLDAAVLTAQSAGARYVGTVMPYAGWELRAAGYPAATHEMCRRLLTEDFFYLAFDQRMDRYRDEGAYLRFLATVVERYDGDGVDDMPGLTAPVKYWQIHNEPEGEHCGGYRYDVAAFVRHMKISYETVKAACADCVVLNGGAGIPLVHENRNPVPEGVHFWRDYAAFGGAPYIDAIAVHYNQGKDPGNGSVDDLEYQITRAREILGAAKPVWVTEFGVVIGDRGKFKGMTETAAAAWYIRMYAAGLAAGAVRFFPDAPSFVEMDGTVYLTFYVQKMLQAKLGGFTSAAKLASGQYRFRAGTSDVYVLWSGVPSTLTGNVTAYDMYGNETRTTAASLRPSESSPLLVVAPAATGSRRRASSR